MMKISIIDPARMSTKKLSVRACDSNVGQYYEIFTNGKVLFLILKVNFTSKILLLSDDTYV